MMMMMMMMLMITIGERVENTPLGLNVVFGGSVLICVLRLTAAVSTNETVSLNVSLRHLGCGTNPKLNYIAKSDVMKKSDPQLST